MSKPSYAGKITGGGALRAEALFPADKPPRGKVNAAKESKTGAKS
jgi:hypothetical protein